MSDATVQYGIEQYKIAKDASIRQFEYLSNEALIMTALAELVRGEVKARRSIGNGDPELSALQTVLLRRVAKGESDTDLNGD